MYYIYVLESEKNGSFYIGQTINLEERLKSHNLGEDNYTRKYRPWKLRHSIIITTSKDAIKLERYLRNLKSRKKVEEWFEHEKKHVLTSVDSSD